MDQSAPYSSDREAAAKTSVWQEFMELVRKAFSPSGGARNDWLMPFEPGPSSFRRPTPAEHRVVKPRRRRRPF